MVNDEDEFEIEVVELAPAITVEAEVVEPEPAPKTYPPAEQLAPSLREVFDEVLSTMPKVTEAQAVILVRTWVPKLGPDRFFSVFWASLGAMVTTYADMDRRMADAWEEGQKTRYADAEIKRYKATGSQERRTAVARRFGGIIRRIGEPGFDYRAEVANACEELGIRRSA